MEPTGTLTIPLVYGLGLEQDLILGNRDRQGGGQGGDKGPSRPTISASPWSARTALVSRSG